MKKRITIVLAALTALFLLSSCSLMPASRLESMFRTDTDSMICGNVPAAGGDYVTISREEYEQYRQYAEKVSQFSEMFQILDDAEKEFYQEVDTAKMVEYATRGLMAGLDDPYSFYYSPEEYAKMREDDAGEFVGIGVMIQTNEETRKSIIIRVFDGGPAKEAGVQRGDILYRVGEDLYVTPENVEEAVSIMRGEPGTDVDVTFLRNGEEITYTITRRMVNVNQVDSELIRPSVGYIALYEFGGHAELEFENALNQLLEQGAKGIIIDLRDNKGGWVDQARYIADLFMDEGELCYMKNRDGEIHEWYYRTTDGKADVKLVILINENSASSSEILTGALRDCAGAVTVGVKSFGKGIIQSVNELENSEAAYQITVAQYYTPNGSEVHKIGITPDYEVPLPEGDNGMYDFADTVHDVQLIKALEVMEEMLQ